MHMDEKYIYIAACSMLSMPTCTCATINSQLVRFSRHIRCKNAMVTSNDGVPAVGTHALSVSHSTVE